MTETTTDNSARYQRPHYAPGVPGVIEPEESEDRS